MLSSVVDSGDDLPRVTVDQFSVILAGDAHSAQLHAVLPGPLVRVTNRAQLRSAVLRGAILFVDLEMIDQLEGLTLATPIVAIVDGKDALSTTVRTLAQYPWLSHVLTPALLTSPRACTHLALLLESLVDGPQQTLLGGGGFGRVALLAQASRREARLARMQQFFAKHGISERVITTIVEVAEELVMNALYDAPSEARYFAKPRQRIEDVHLPPELACEISYGIEDETIFVRVRDPFGALSRKRLFEVLSRCNSRTVTLDESRGGAGLGLWRVFAAASSVAIRVMPGSLTEIVVGIGTRNGRALAKQLHAVDMFFAPRNEDYEALAIIPDDAHGELDHSITLIRVA